MLDGGDGHSHILNDAVGRGQFADIGRFLNVRDGRWAEGRPTKDCHRNPRDSLEGLAELVQIGQKAPLPGWRSRLSKQARLSK